MSAPFCQDTAGSFTLAHGDTLHLSPFGEFPHSKGLQIIDPEAVETLLRNFRSFLGRMGRRFGGVPLYIGHPDVPGYEAIYTDRKACGWIMELTAEEGGLYGRVKWSRAGRELILNAHYKSIFRPFGRRGRRARATGGSCSARTRSSRWG